MTAVPLVDSVKFSVCFWLADSLIFIRLSDFGRLSISEDSCSETLFFWESKKKKKKPKPKANVLKWHSEQWYNDY